MVCVALLLWLAGVYVVANFALPTADAAGPADAGSADAGAAPVGPASAEAAAQTPAYSDLLLVGLAPTVSPQEANGIFAGLGLIPEHHWPEFALAAVRLAPAEGSRNRDEALATARTQLAQQPGVRYVENDWAIDAASHTPPNDPLFVEQWALAKINMPAAWDTTVGDPNVIVALIDSGLGIEHEDLDGISLWTNESERNGVPGLDDDANGYVDDINGWDWVGNDNRFDDPYGHGTHVGGVLTARTDNGIGVASVGRNLTLMPLRVLDERGSGFISYLVDALSYARRKGVSIVNLSLVLRLDSDAVADSVRGFAATGGLIVAATGNYGSQVYWPAAYTETLAVAATSADDSRSPFSNRGPETDLAAPGSLILSTYLHNSYYLNDGTSMAVPHVSALAALVWSLRPDWDWIQVKNHLKATAVDVNAATLPGPDNDIGHGRIDAAAALTQAGMGISFTVDYLAGQYTLVEQRLRIPMQLTVTRKNGVIVPVVGALIHYELLGAPEIGSGASVASQLLTGTLTSSSTGSALLDIETPGQVGNYELRLRMAGQEKVYPIALQDGPLNLAVETDRTVLDVGGDAHTQMVISARTGTQNELLTDPLLVHVTMTLGTFPDGSQQHTLWMLNGVITQTIVPGRVAGVAEILVTAAEQSQRTFVTIRPGPAQRIRGQHRLFVQDWGQGALAPIQLDLQDQYGNPIENGSRVNFYSMRSSFTPQSPLSTMGRVETFLFLPAWLPAQVEYWAMVPGTFSTFQGDVVVLRNHFWLPQVVQAAATGQ